MLEGIQCLGHSSIKIEKIEKVIYIDPYDIEVTENDADIIFITHSHYDHFSKEDILKLKNEKTQIVVTEDLIKETENLGFDKSQITIVKPNESYTVMGIGFSTIPAYNTNKKFHPKENNWVGYLIELDRIKYYIAGDTDVTEENKKVICDVAFVPIGGTYTMTYIEAADLVNEIRPKIAIPIHYGKIVGTKDDAQMFKKFLTQEVGCEILIK